MSRASKTKKPSKLQKTIDFSKVRLYNIKACLCRESRMGIRPEPHN